jgi:branched-chain amino acid transport system permease protein
MEFLSNVINGISLGSIYAIIALGYTMVYGIAKMLNFAHGDVIMVGAYVCFFMTSRYNMPAIVGILLSMFVCTVLGMTIERLAYKPLRQATSLAVLITAIGMSYFLQNAAQLLWTSNPKVFKSVVGDGGIQLAEGLYVSHVTLVTIAACVIIMIALTVFTGKSKMGKAMRACSEDKGAAQLMGINVNNIIMITFAIGSALVSLASLFFLLKAPTMTPTFGALPGIKAFTAAVIGGIGSIPGAMLGGLLLGVIECFAQSVPAISPYTDTIEFSILIIILLVKPTGLLGKKRREKV